MNAENFAIGCLDMVSGRNFINFFKVLPLELADFIGHKIRHF
jgi:hypothetical protein